jgi:hypothetical protein
MTQCGILASLTSLEEPEIEKTLSAKKRKKKRKSTVQNKAL